MCLVPSFIRTLSVIVVLLATSPFSLPAERVLWTNPGVVEAVDFSEGAGGKTKAPKPPYIFIREDFSGTSPKIAVRDAEGTEWRVKGGLEVRAEAFITRFIGALGYYAETTYFLSKGRIEKVKDLKRAAGFVSRDGSFTYAAFERRDPELIFSRTRWSWDRSPFRGTRELNGLKVLIMLFSNWDNKDERDEYRGSNTGVLQTRDGRKQLYFVNDWGQSFGSWGRWLGRSNWNCSEFTAQTPDYAPAVRSGFVQFGYGGQHTVGFRDGIRVDDVKWLMGYLGRITDAQIRTGLLVSGASREEGECFTRALRDRIERLRALTMTAR